MFSLSFTTRSVFQKCEKSRVQPIPKNGNSKSSVNKSPIVLVAKSWKKSLRIDFLQSRGVNFDLIMRYVTLPRDVYNFNGAFLLKYL